MKDDLDPRAGKSSGYSASQTETLYKKLHAYLRANPLCTKDDVEGKGFNSIVMRLYGGSLRRAKEGAGLSQKYVMRDVRKGKPIPRLRKEKNSREFGKRGKFHPPRRVS